MNIRQILDTIKKPFGKGEKFEKYAPAAKKYGMIDEVLSKK